MTNAQSLCSTPDHLLAFLRGRLSERDASELQDHLETCESCRLRLESTAAGANAWKEAERFLGDTPHQNSGDDSPIDRASRTSLQIEQVLQSLGPTDDPQSLGRIGGYEVTGVIGAGGMGVVLKAHERALDRVVAIKVMAPHLASSGSARRRFAREAKAAAAVIHPNVIAIHGVSNEGSLPYLVMPFVGGNSLQKRIDDDGPLTTAEVLRVGSQIAAGLGAAHDQGLVHRDIKPANILLDNGVERVSITDFGLARAVDDAAMTRTGIIAGTPQFMSPEQARGESIDHRGDLFSLGSVLYTMCTGRPPFRAETSFGVLRRITDDEPKPIREINADIPDWLCAIISKLMDKQASERFESTEEVARLLEDCLAHVQQPTTTTLPASVAELARSFGQLHTSESAESLGDFRFPPIGKLIAAAFGFVLIFAGVLVVLELNKGTLKIESNADDIPIRIVQGDNIVEQMAVTKIGQTVRIAAGQYVVEIDREFDGFEIVGGAVSLKRGGEETIKVVRTQGEGANDEMMGLGIGMEEDLDMVDATESSEAEPSPPALTPSEQALAKLEAEFSKLQLAYAQAEEHAGDEVELNRVYEEMDPRHLMAPKYLAMEQQHRGTDSGLQALIEVCSLARSVGDPSSAAAQGRAEAVKRVVEHYLDREGLESIVQSLNGGPFLSPADDLLEALVRKSPHRKTQAAALIAQIIHAKETLAVEFSLDEIRKMVEQRLAMAPKHMRGEFEERFRKLEQTDFQQMRREVDEKLKRLGELYSDVPVQFYGTGREAEGRLSHAINNVIVAKPAPELAGTDLDGKPFRLSELRGKVVVVMFAQSTSDDYSDMYAPVRQLVAKYRHAPVRFVGVMSNDGTAMMKAAVKRGDINWTVIPQPYNGPLQLDWGIQGYPTVYFVDSKGTLQSPVGMSFYGEGGFDTSDVDDRIAALLSKPPRDFEEAPVVSSSPKLHGQVAETDAQHAARVNSDKIVVDLYCGDDVMPQMNTHGPNKDRHIKMSLALVELDGVTANYRTDGPGNEIAKAIIRCPVGYKESDAKLRVVTAIESILQKAGVLRTQIVVNHANGSSKRSLVPPQKIEDAKAEIQGRWVSETFVDGFEHPLKERDSVEVEVDDDMLTIRAGSTIWKYPMRIFWMRTGNENSADQIHSIDLTLLENRPMVDYPDRWPGIIQCDGETLTLCFAKKSRPKRFLQGEDVCFIRCRRVENSDSSDRRRQGDVSQLRTLNEITSGFNEQTRSLRHELFAPPIPNLTTEQMRLAMLDSANVYQKQGQVEIATALKSSAESGLLVDSLTYLGMSGTSSPSFRQIIPMLTFKSGSQTLTAVFLDKAQLRYSRDGWSSSTWGDIRPPLTGTWELVSVEQNGETLSQESLYQWIREHVDWEGLAIDQTTLSMLGDAAETFDFKIVYGAGPLPQYRLSQDGNTRYAGVLMGNGFVDDTKLTIAIDLDGRSKPTTFQTIDGVTTKLTYHRSSSPVSDTLSPMQTGERLHGAEAKSLSPAKEMQQRLQGTWDVNVFDTYDADTGVGKQTYQAVIRGEVLLLQSVANGKVRGAFAWKLVWPNADQADEVDVIYDPNNSTEAEAAPGRISCDGNGFQLAVRVDSVDEKRSRPSEICPGENIYYIECVRTADGARMDKKRIAETVATQAFDSSKKNQPKPATGKESRLIQRIQGKWRVVRIVDSEGADCKPRKQSECIFEGHRMISLGEGMQVDLPFRLDETTSPAQLDLLAEDETNSNILGLVDVTGDKFRWVSAGNTGGGSDPVRPSRLEPILGFRYVEMDRVIEEEEEKTLPGNSSRKLVVVGGDEQTRKAIQKRILQLIDEVTQQWGGPQREKIQAGEHPPIKIVTEPQSTKGLGTLVGASTIVHHGTLPELLDTHLPTLIVRLVLNQRINTVLPEWLDAGIRTGMSEQDAENQRATLRRAFDTKQWMSLRNLLTHSVATVGPDTPRGAKKRQADESFVAQSTAFCQFFVDQWGNEALVHFVISLEDNEKAALKSLGIDSLAVLEREFHLWINKTTLAKETVSTTAEQIVNPDSAKPEVSETTVTEVEGDWHMVERCDTEGNSQEVLPHNRTYKGERCIAAWAGGGHECRIQVNPEPKTIWSFIKGEDHSFFVDHYELQGGKLILTDDTGKGKRRAVYERGHVRIPNVVQAVTEQQVGRWRSAVVEIMVSETPDGTVADPRSVGFGVIVRNDGTLVLHINTKWDGIDIEQANINAKFDDGSQVPIERVAGNSSVLVLRPKDPVSLNHHFPFSLDTTEVGDEVYVGQLTLPSTDAKAMHSLAATKVHLAQVDRRMATMDTPIWQLKAVQRIPNSHCLPVLSGDGELLAITMTNTGGLLLAIPTVRLIEMFPEILDEKALDEIAESDTF